MRAQRLLDPSSQPPVGFNYIDPDTGWETKQRSLFELLKHARLHREANGLPIAADFDILVETQLCKRSPGRCVHLDGLPPDTTCTHRGTEALRWEGCGTCGGVRAKIVSCALYGECSEFKHLVGVRMCALCPSRESTLTEAEK